MELLAIFIEVTILLFSLAVWGQVFERLTQGEPLLERPVPATRPRPMIAIVLTFAWILLSLSSLLTKDERVLQFTQPNELQALLLLGSNLLIQVTTTCVLLVCLNRLGSQGLTRFGIDLRQPHQAIGIGLLGYLAAMIPVVLANLAMSQFRTPENEHPFLQILKSQQSVPLVALLVGSVVIMAPLGEELMYRVILQGTLQRSLPPAVAISISSVVFCTVHGFPDAVGLLPLALILGFVYWRTGSYLAIVTTHAAFNGTSVLLVLLSPEA